jgi:hypothetical protein
LVPIVVPWSTWSIVARDISERAHNWAIPTTTPREGSSGVVGPAADVEVLEGRVNRALLDPSHQNIPFAQ